MSAVAETDIRPKTRVRERAEEQSSAMDDAQQAAISIPVADLLEMMFNGVINPVATPATQNCER